MTNPVFGNTKKATTAQDTTMNPLVSARRTPSLKFRPISTLIVLVTLMRIEFHKVQGLRFNTVLSSTSRIGFPIAEEQSILSNKVQSTAAVATKSITEQSSILRRISRGGALLDEDEEDDDDDNVDFDDDDDDDDDDDSLLFDDTDFGDETDGSITANDVGFQEGNIITKIIDAWKYKTPPITKAYLSCSFAVTAYAYLFNKNEFPNILLLDWTKIVSRFQIWRLITSFFNFGPASLGYLMTCQFIWVYMSTLERLNHNKPYDFIIMILFGQLCMIIGYPLLKLSPKFLGHNLSTFLVYIWSRYHEGVEVNMFELFNARAEMLPWFFLAQTFLLEGEIPVLDFLGIVFGHVYHHCYTIGLLRAPPSVRQWYEGNSKLATQVRELYKPVSADFEMAV